jgi:hypothetical protein
VLGYGIKAFSAETLFRQSLGEPLWVQGSLGTSRSPYLNTAFVIIGAVQYHYVLFYSLFSSLPYRSGGRLQKP